jgi:hypothetical protein
MGLARYDFAVVVEVLARLAGLPGRLPDPAP